MYYNMQILMSVLRVQVVVVMYATTLREVIGVDVQSVIDWQVTIVTVWVCESKSNSTLLYT